MGARPSRRLAAHLRPQAAGSWLLASPVVGVTLTKISPAPTTIWRPLGAEVDPRPPRAGHSPSHATPLGSPARCAQCTHSSIGHPDARRTRSRPAIRL
ncbi:hypothetical protein VTO73DRAFT_4303 [Trametes versicolor]